MAGSCLQDLTVEVSSFRLGTPAAGSGPEDLKVKVASCRPGPSQPLPTVVSELQTSKHQGFGLAPAAGSDLEALNVETSGFGLGAPAAGSGVEVLKRRSSKLAASGCRCRQWSRGFKGRSVKLSAWGSRWR